MHNKNKLPLTLVHFYGLSDWPMTMSMTGNVDHLNTRHYVDIEFKQYPIGLLTTNKVLNTHHLIHRASITVHQNILRKDSPPIHLLRAPVCFHWIMTSQCLMTSWDGESHRKRSIFRTCLAASCWCHIGVTSGARPRVILSPTPYKIS